MPRGWTLVKLCPHARSRKQKEPLVGVWGQGEQRTKSGDPCPSPSKVTARQPCDLGLREVGQMLLVILPCTGAGNMWANSAEALMCSTLASYCPD